jgi:acetolactate synthase I/II/III large subunit
MKGTEFVLRTLPKAGVNHLFMFVGGLVDPFLAPASAGIITPVVAANEAGAVYAADGYARASRKFGAALVIGGPGAFNAVGAVAAASADGVPLLLITGETATGQQGRGAFQDATGLGVDDVRPFESLTECSHIVPAPAALAQFLRVTYHAMLSERRHPVHLAIPRDVQTSDVGAPHWEALWSLESPRVLDADAFAAFGRDALSHSTRIVILAGGGALASDAADDLRSVAEAFQIPVATTFRAKGIVPEDHPLSLGMFGYAGHPPAEDCLTSPELEAILVLGSSLNQRDTLSWSARLAPSKGIAQVNSFARELGTNFPVRYPVVGDVRTALRALANPDAPWAANLRRTASARRQWADTYLKRPRFLDAENLTSDAVPIHPARIIHELRQALPRDAALLIDSGAHRAFAGHYFPVLQPHRMFSATGLGPMGWAIGASIGVAVALPQTRIAVVTGDGCMLQNGVEIQTAGRHGLDILYMVLNNSALGNVWLRARREGEGPRRLTELPTHDWAAFATALGVRGLRVDEPSGLAPAFAEFVQFGGPTLVDVRCERAAATPIAPWVESLTHPDIYAE